MTQQEKIEEELRNRIKLIVFEELGQVFETLGKIDTHHSAINTLTQQWHNSKKIEWHQDQIRSLQASLKGKEDV